MASVLPASRQTKVDSLAVVWMTPPPREPVVLWRNWGGRPIILPSQSMTRDSSSVAAGEEAQVKPRQLMPSASMSPSREG